jgi:hypothetical protein
MLVLSEAGWRPDEMRKMFSCIALSRKDKSNAWLASTAVHSIHLSLQDLIQGRVVSFRDCFLRKNVLELLLWLDLVFHRISRQFRIAVIVPVDVKVQLIDRLAALDWVQQLMTRRRSLVNPFAKSSPFQ